MPKIYVLLSKGFVVNDGRLAGGRGTWPLSNAISSYICCAQSLRCYFSLSVGEAGSAFGS